MYIIMLLDLFANALLENVAIKRNSFFTIKNAKFILIKNVQIMLYFVLSSSKTNTL